MRRVRHLLPTLGARPALMFGAVSFLVAALLATVNLTSRYALKLYVEDQLRRIRWDLAVYQKGAPGSTMQFLPDALRQVPKVRQVEAMAFLRAQFPPDGEVVARVDGERIMAPWVSLLAATDPTVLPPQLALALNEPGGQSRSAVLALVGPEREIGKSFLDLQGAHEFTVNVSMGDEERRLFGAPIKKTIRLERDELNRWVMDQTGSVTYIPHIGLIVVLPFDTDALERFDSVAAGLVPKTMLGPGDADYGHVHEAEYEPEVAYLAQFDRMGLISGWDIPGSLARVAAANHEVEDAAFEAVRTDILGERHHSSIQPATPLTGGARIVPAHDPTGADAEERKSFAAKFIVDSTTEVLLGRMERLARIVGLVTVLVALPLLWVAWLLASNLAGLLMLNERRKLGLMRLRGVPGAIIGQALLLSIVGGGLVGGVLGVAAGSVVPLLFYERGSLPLEVLTSPRQLGMAGALLAVSVLMSYIVSRRLVKYATTISPLEASARVAASEPGKAGLRFGPLQVGSLLVGVVVLGSWMWGAELRERIGLQNALLVRLVDFAGLPLFVYGVAALLASRRQWLEPIVRPLTRLAGGVLGSTAERHIAVKPHRTLAFLLIVALMASVSLYPTVTSRSFEDKAERGARVQLGADWQLLFSAPDLVSTDALQGGLEHQLAALRPAIQRITSQVAQVQGVAGVTSMIEAVLPNFYLPDYGMRGVPAYLIDDLPGYEKTIYVEPQVGVTSPFDDLTARLAQGEVLVSPPVALFKKLQVGKPLRLGVDGNKQSVIGATGGVLAFLPGIPPRTVTDRQGYVQARIDYLNYLFSNNAYVVATAGNPKIKDLRALIPRVIVLARGAEGAPAADVQARILSALSVAPLETHNLTEEVGKVASDMYISLALANMRIYLVGGILLALIAIVSVAAVNYVEDRRTLALLRIRGASPSHLWRFILALLVAPAIVGLIVGALAALVAGFGLANHVWELREIRTVVQLLPTRLLISGLWVSVALLLLVLIVGVASLFSAWVYRRTAHRSLQGA